MFHVQMLDKARKASPSERHQYPSIELMVCCTSGQSRSSVEMAVSDTDPTESTMKSG